MKKLLLASSALFSLGVVSAQAADDPISLSLKGTAVENAGYASNYRMNGSGVPSPARIDTVAEQDDATISALGKITLDNDISVALQGDVYGTASRLTRSTGGGCGTNKPSIVSSRCASNLALKRAFMTIASPVGTLILGDREDASYLIHNSAPDVSPLARSSGGYFYYWVVAPANHRNMTVDNDSRYDDRSNKISYVTPAFAGLSAAFSYVPKLSSSVGSGSATPATASDYGLFVPGGQVTGADYGGDAYVGGLYYSESLYGVGVKADSSMLQANTANLRIWQQGVQLMYAGFTLGGSSLVRDVPGNATLNNLYTDTAAITLAGAGSSAATVAQAAVFAGNGYTVGLRYALGPYSVSTLFFHDNSKSLAALNGSGRADSTDFYDVGAAYDMGTAFDGGPRVTLRAGVGYVSYKGSVANTAAPWANNNDGVAAVTGVKLDF
ncbi:porin [Telmatospirillum sp.]|uniref:porin n=1 Tax=Telmatospirillum sp. TaxID=2079197 RepID=UPI002845C92B|nr:porin [Telmatospirillum sp.]MDR3439589.1 porin [Telmatospirillum sp.]